MANLTGYGMFHESRKTGIKIKQSIVRLRENDFKALKEKVATDGLSLQKFFQLAAECYLQNDPDMLLLVSKWLRQLHEERKSIKGNLGSLKDKDADELYAIIEGKNVEEDAEAE